MSIKWPVGEYNGRNYFRWFFRLFRFALEGCVAEHDKFNLFPKVRKVGNEFVPLGVALMNNLLKANKLLIIYWFKSKIAIKSIDISGGSGSEIFRFQIHYGKGKIKRFSF